MQIILGNLNFKATVNFRMDFIQIIVINPERGIAASPHTLKNVAQNCKSLSYPFSDVSVGLHFYEIGRINWVSIRQILDPSL